VRLSHKKELKGYDSKIKECQKEWVKQTNHAKKLKKDLDVLINSEREKNSQNIGAFEDLLKSELNKIKDEAYTKYETGTEKAYEGLAQFEIKLEKLGAELEQNQQLANGFDDDNATNGCRGH